MAGEKIVHDEHHRREWLSEEIPVDGVAQESLTELRRLLEGNWQPSKVSHLQMTQALVMCLEYASRHPAAQTAGVALVSDFEGWSFGKMRFFDIGVTKDYLHYLQNCAPIVPNEAHVIRQPAAFSVMFALMRPFMRDETINAIKFHGKHVDQLYADISPSTLFAEYGGTAPNTDWDLFWTSVCQEHNEGKAGRQL
ncbi:hypothetical protein HPB49_020619 [Dermacentor silvarum]|uniref:Uncharacterized protein n=1 Tax=Dermacentor silvarum TaxID=543639 RepID=A0ACB8CMR8_DERSI|nr:hypothetical protein HPB49_020619 [Dermacentor silvarum]